MLPKCRNLQLRHGILLFAFVRLVGSVFALGMDFLITTGLLAFGHLDYVMIVVVLTILVLIGFDVIFNFVLIVGSLTRNKSLLRAYLIYGVIYTVIVGFALLVWLARSALDAWTYPEDNKPDLLSQILQAVLFVAIVLLLQMYLMTLVRIEIINLCANRQIRCSNRKAETESSLQPEKDDVI